MRKTSLTEKAGHLLVLCVNFDVLKAISKTWEKVGGTGVKAQ